MKRCNVSGVLFFISSNPKPFYTCCHNLGPMQFFSTIYSWQQFSACVSWGHHTSYFLYRTTFFAIENTKSTMFKHVSCSWLAQIFIYCLFGLFFFIITTNTKNSHKTRCYFFFCRVNIVNNISIPCHQNCRCLTPKFCMTKWANKNRSSSETYEHDIEFHGENRIEILTELYGVAKQLNKRCHWKSLRSNKTTNCIQF